MTELGDPVKRAELLEAIRPDEAQLHQAELRRLFRAEVAHRRARGSDEHSENLYWCAFLLSQVGDPSDVPMMWEAKHLDFDTAAGFDVQFMLGAGADATLTYLRANGHDDIARELESFPELNENLDRWVEFRRQYFYGGEPE